MRARFDLDRFVAAQRDCFDAAFAEIAAGQKQGHWMWFIFPQLRGLGRSAMAERYGIGSLEEAVAYLAHPMLGPRLHACVEALGRSPAADAVAIFGELDAMKLRSSLTLFTEAGGGRLFEMALARWFGGRKDDATLQLLRIARPDEKRH